MLTTFDIVAIALLAGGLLGIAFFWLFIAAVVCDALDKYQERNRK